MRIHLRYKNFKWRIGFKITYLELPGKNLNSALVKRIEIMIKEIRNPDMEWSAQDTEAIKWFNDSGWK